jgi:fructokinase
VRIGIDLGGTKIEVLALDDAGHALLRRRIPTPSGDYVAILNAVADLVFGAEKELGRPGTVGIATPGAISTRTGVVKNSNSTALNGKFLDRDLGKILGRPVRLENDANCFALSEAMDGAGADATVVFGVILGTGVGGGLVIDRKIVSGRNKVAGEWGHNPLPWPTRGEQPGCDCYCGKSGCIETFLSGAGLAREYRSRAGTALTAEEIAVLAARGDNLAGQSLETYKDRLARSLAGVINVLDPDVIVLGGGLSNIDQLYVGILPLIDNYAFSDGVDTSVRRATHGDSSGVRGAAWLWPNAAPSQN